MASSARDIMTGGTECVGEHDSIAEAAKTMQRLSVGALPICGDNQRLQGMITDRDIVVKVVAQGKDPASTTAGELAQGKPVTIGADDSIDELVATMSREKVKRLPVIDGHRPGRDRHRVRRGGPRPAGHGDRPGEERVRHRLSRRTVLPVPVA